ncbi:MAG: PhnD/SsuA/transferrin family substrate-binding protein [Oscillibacter sp.]|jgi:NitT/TauT family transport system substrate-binding protein|nr:PhnD/SsuA/transferrin family substrate-binding protein [Oscillibacter sp.]
MNNLKRWAAIALSALMMTAILAGCGPDRSGATPSASSGVEEEPFTPASYSVAALKGPTAMGLVKLMSDADAGETDNDYTFTIAASADEIAPKLIKGDLDMACVPANLASVLYSKTQGGIVTLAVNTLGVLYVVENGNAVQSIGDLAGKTIVAAGKGSTPEYALRYLLEQNGLDPDTDVTIDWKSEHAECVSALASGEATIALLPQPFVTVAQSKLSDLRVALDLTQEWDALKGGSSLLTGVIVARKEITEENPAAVDAFLADYAASVDWVNANVSDAAALIGSYDIVDAVVAEKALPACNIVCLTGTDLKTALGGYLEVLYEQNAQSVGGAVPGDDFYYGA